MSASVNTKHEVAVSILSGNVDVSKNNGKMIFTVSSSYSVLHAASKLEAIGLALVRDAKQLQEKFPPAASQIGRPISDNPQA